ncbi:peptidyl-Lys metalloendopeptidase [Rhizoctonia solani]|uniref:Peptidyl-Lys metalloendopeptidase n=1 Tax=Rhizoctonia solani TaxID=456999 RepID=A0A8H8SX12_9AGAM|nr:peptidyl-Lys metalloendopeptidase [Rhizoctonia solani]QRW20924.1 peptidyl-Lys metalloendopeptidase [Rhizoctonia solani]
MLLIPQNARYYYLHLVHRIIAQFHVNATLSNTGSETLRLLRDPRSPLSTWATETFGVINSKGWSSDSFVELNPGESVTVKHDLAGVYNLTLTGTGTYTVDAANLFPKVKIQGKLVSFKNAAATPVVSLLSEYTEYSGCTANQQGEIAGAIESARGYATSSYDHLRSNPYGSSVTLVGLGGSHTIRSFMKGPISPQLLGSTSDYAYGQSNCLALARSNPTNAVYNADNHAFFSVDTEIR